MYLGQRLRELNEIIQKKKSMHLEMVYYNGKNTNLESESHGVKSSLGTISQL